MTGKPFKVADIGLAGFGRKDRSGRERDAGTHG